MENPLSNRELFKRVLLDSGLFEEPEGALREAFDLKASGKECYLFASYGAPLSGYFLYDEETLIRPIGDGEAFYAPWPPISSVRTTELEEFEAQLEEPLGYRFGFPVGSLSLDLLSKDRALVESIFREDKLVKLLPLERPEDVTAVKGSTKGYFYNLKEFMGKCRELGVKPSNVLVLTKDPLNDESFYQYLAGVLLRKENYLVTEMPLRRPLLADIFGYRSKGFSKGAFLLEVCLGMGGIGKGGNNEESAVLVEAEPTPERGASSDHGVGQASRYLDQAGGFFERGFVAAPMIVHLMQSEHRVGIMTFDKEGKIHSSDAPKSAGFRVGETVKDAEFVERLAEMNAAMRQQSLDWLLEAPTPPAPPGTPSFEDLYDGGAVRVRITYSDGRVIWSGVVAKSTARGIVKGTRKVDPGAKVEIFPPESGPPEEGD